MNNSKQLLSLLKEQYCLFFPMVWSSLVVTFNALISCRFHLNDIIEPIFRCMNSVTFVTEIWSSFIRLNLRNGLYTLHEYDLRQLARKVTIFHKKNENVSIDKNFFWFWNRFGFKNRYSKHSEMPKYEHRYPLR